MPTIDAPTPTLPPLTRPAPLGIPGFDEIEDIRSGADISGPWIVIIYNDDWHSFDEVEDILQKATGCDTDKAQAIALEVHMRGRSICFSGSRDECENVAAIIATIRLQVETDRA